MKTKIESEKTGVTRRWVYFTMIQHPADGWMRVGKAYSKRSTAKGWLSFARAAWRGLPGRVNACRLVWRDGKLDAASCARLEAFNMTPP